MGPSGLSLGGKITNWPAPQTGALRFKVSNKTQFAVGPTTAVDGNGNFANLLLPSSEVADQLVTTPNDPACAGVNFNPPTASSATASIEVLNANNLVVGTVNESTKDFNNSQTVLANGDKQVLRTYANTNVTLKGVCTTQTAGKTTYNLNLVKGWNIVIVEFTKVTATAIEETTVSTGGLPADIKLFYSTVTANAVKFNPFLSGR